MKAKFMLAGLAAFTLLFTSCKKTVTGPEGPQGPQGGSGPALTGNLKGFINHYDVSGAKVTTDLTGDSVYIDGTGRSTITNSAGLFSFSGISTGVYNITVKKSGSVYGYTKIQNIEFAGNGDTYRNAALSATPTNTVSTFMAYDTTISTVNYVRVRGTVPSSPRVQSVIAFVGAPGSTTVNSSLNSSYYVINIAANATTFSRNIPTTDLYDLGYASGNTAYYSAYMIGSNTGASSYVDFTTNRNVFTAISTNSIGAQAAVQ